MSVNIAAQASQAAAQGQQMLNDDLNQASNYKNQYNQYQQQADAANKNVSNYAGYMQGEGSAGNQFHNELGSELGTLGYDENQMTAARGNLNQATGAMSAYNDYANSAASKWGMNAGGFAAANAGALGSLNNNIASNQQVVTGLSDLYKTAQTGANAFTGQVVEGEKNTLAGLQDVYNNAASQRDSAGEMLQFFNDQAQKQGGLNAQQQQYYAAAQQAYASASAAMAQAALYGKQASQIQQQIDMANAAAKQPTAGAGGGQPSAPTKNAAAASAPAWYSPSNILSEVGNVYHGAQQAGGVSQDIKNLIGQKLFNR